MNNQKKQLIALLRSAKPDEIQKILENNPLAKDCLNIHSLGFPTYYKCVTTLHPEYSPTTLTEMQSQLNHIYQQYKNNIISETNVRANLAILALNNSNLKLYKECLDKKLLSEDCDKFCKSQYDFAKVFLTIRKAYKDYKDKDKDSDRTELLNLFKSEYHKKLIHSCLTSNYLPTSVVNFVNSISPSSFKEYLEQTTKDQKTAIKTLLVRNIETYTTPKELYESLDKLFQDPTSERLVQKCFKELDPESQKKYINNVLIYFSKSKKPEDIERFERLNPDLFNKCLSSSPPNIKKAVAKIVRPDESLIKSKSNEM